MNTQPLIDVLQRLLDLGIGGGVAVVAAIFVVRHSVAKAVELAGIRELERLKQSLGLELESRRQDFARELEHERGAAARALEQFKAELSLQAEMRRQVAARKVEAVVEIVSLGEILSRGFSRMPSGREDHAADLLRDVTVYARKVRDSAFLFESATAEGLRSYADRMLEASSIWEKGIPGAEEVAKTAYTSMLGLVQGELGVSGQARSA